MNCLYQLRTNIMFTKSDSFLHVSSSNTGLNDILHVTYFFLSKCERCSQDYKYYSTKIDL